MSDNDHATYDEAIYAAKLLTGRLAGDSPEYERGQINLIADIWGRFEVPTDIRMEEVERDILEFDEFRYLAASAANHEAGCRCFHCLCAQPPVPKERLAILPDEDEEGDYDDPWQVVVRLDDGTSLCPGTGPVELNTAAAIVADRRIVGHTSDDSSIVVLPPTSNDS